MIFIIYSHTYDIFIVKLFNFTLKCNNQFDIIFKNKIFYNYNNA